MCLRLVLSAGGLQVASATRYVLEAYDLVTWFSCAYAPTISCKPSVNFCFNALA